MRDGRAGYDLWSAVSSLMPSLKFLMALPIPRPNCGRRFAPKTMITMKRMISISGSPMRPIAALLWSDAVRTQDRGANVTATPILSPLKWASCVALLASAGTMLPPSAARAQFTASVSLVEVYATVTDRGGRLVTDLAESDFQVEEDGRPQRIEAFARGDFPLAVAIGIDRSFSIPPPRLAATVAASKAFLQTLRPTDRATVLAIGSEIETLAPLSVDRAEARAALDRLDRWGTTPLYDAVVGALDVVQPAAGRRALILLSDGTDRYSKTSQAEMLTAARARDVLVYPVATDGRSAPVMVELAAATGGRSFAASERSLSTTLGTIRDELRHQYLLGYAPPAPVSPPTGEPTGGRAAWRSIRVRVTRPGVRVRAREGYRAP